MIVSSPDHPRIHSDMIPSSLLSKSKEGQSAKVIEITDEINVHLTKFGREFWKYLLNKFPEIARHIQTAGVQSITYSDRYLQNPSSVLMITEILSFFAQDGEASLTLKTLFNEKDRVGRLVSHDWCLSKDFKCILGGWLTRRVGFSPAIIVETIRHEIPHRRLLTLELKNGMLIEIRFDQGVGYWQLDCDNRKHIYDFDMPAAQQVEGLHEILKNSRVRNSSKWSTDISINIMRPADL